jgi:hypothetical protein
MPRFLMATTYLRCVLLDCAAVLRPMLIAAAQFDATDQAILEDVANRLASDGHNRKRVSSNVLASELAALQAIFGPHRSPSNSDEPGGDNDRLDPALKQSLASGPIDARAKWGELEHIVVPQ